MKMGWPLELQIDLIQNPRIRNLDRFYRMVFVICVLGDGRQA